MQNPDTSTTSIEIPVVNLSEDLNTVGSALDAAYSSVGFCQIVGHGLDPKLEAAAWTLAQQFFALPEHEKERCSIATGEAYGYGPFQAERLAASLGEVTPPDLKETFSVGPGFRPSNWKSDETAAFIFSDNRWPSSLPELQPTLEDHYQQLASLTDRIMAAMAVGLGLDEHYFVPLIDQHPSALRCLHYPAQGRTSPEPGQLRAGAHTDYGTLTLLRQQPSVLGTDRTRSPMSPTNQADGLEVKGVDDVWYPVDVISNAYVVNVGDALARWTNGRWQSTVHRVALPSTGAAPSDRFSMAFFHNANWDAIIECLPTCLAPGEEPRFAPITAGRHLMEKFRSTQGRSSQ